MTVEEIERAVAKLPAQDLALFAAWFAEFEIAQFAEGGIYHPTEEEKIGIERGLRDVAEGRFATAEEVAETFAKFRRP
jgi:predicted transcriptional regulator